MSLPNTQNIMVGMEKTVFNNNKKTKNINELEKTNILPRFRRLSLFFRGFWVDL